MPHISMVINDQREQRAGFGLEGRYSSMALFGPSPVTCVDSKSINYHLRVLPVMTNAHQENQGVRAETLQHKWTASRTLHVTFSKLFGHNCKLHSMISLLIWPQSSCRRQKRFSVTQSAHDLSPALSCFAGLGSEPRMLYSIIAFDKLHVLDLGLRRQFCGLTNSVIRGHWTLSLTGLMNRINARHTDRPAPAHLPSMRPLRSTEKDSQAEFSGKMRRHTASFLCCCLIEVSDKHPNDDQLLQCSLKRYAMNSFVRTLQQWTGKSIYDWQEFLFPFGTYMAITYDIDVTKNYTVWFAMWKTTYLTLDT